MRFGESSWFAVLLLVLCLATTPARASIGRAIPEILELLGRAGSEAGEFVGSAISKSKAMLDSLVAPNWSEEEKARLVQILRDRGIPNVAKSSIDELAVEDAWTGKIYPEIKGKWKLEYNETNEQFWKNLENRCIRESFRNSKPEELVENIIGAGLHFTGLSHFGEFLFVAKFLDRKLAEKDAFCLLVSKASEHAIDEAVNSWSGHEGLATCLKELRPPIEDCGP